VFGNRARAPAPFRCRAGRVISRRARRRLVRILREAMVFAEPAPLPLRYLGETSVRDHSGSGRVIAVPSDRGIFVEKKLGFRLTNHVRIRAASRGSVDYQSGHRQTGACSLPLPSPSKNIAGWRIRNFARH